MARARRAFARWSPLIGALALNLAVLYTPDPDAPGDGVPGLDKVVHVTVFAALTWAGLHAGIAARWLVPAVLAHAVISELVQATALPARSGDPWDVVADAAGIALGALLHVLLDRSRRPARHHPG